MIGTESMKGLCFDLTASPQLKEVALSSSSDYSESFSARHFRMLCPILTFPQSAVTAEALYTILLSRAERVVRGDTHMTSAKFSPPLSANSRNLPQYF